MRRRALAYVAALTVLVLFTGAAGMYAFERQAGEAGLSSYGESLWWTAMILTTLGSQYWPQSAEGRVLCLLLSIYSLGILGYLTAALASFFIDQDARSPGTDRQTRDLSRLKRELQILREQNEQLHIEVRTPQRLNQKT